jgi:hypothetical protein
MSARNLNGDQFAQYEQRMDEENAAPGKELTSAPDECVHCGRPVIFNPGTELYNAKDRTSPGGNGENCAVNGQCGHEV